MGSHLEKKKDGASFTETKVLVDMMEISAGQNFSGYLSGGEHDLGE